MAGLVPAIHAAQHSQMHDGWIFLVTNVQTGMPEWRDPSAIWRETRPVNAISPSLRIAVRSHQSRASALRRVVETKWLFLFALAHRPGVDGRDEPGHDGFLEM
jgi:hypothetical protein